MSKSWFWMWGPQWLVWEKRLFFSLDSSWVIPLFKGSKKYCIPFYVMFSSHSVSLLFAFLKAKKESKPLSSQSSNLSYVNWPSFSQAPIDPSYGLSSLPGLVESGNHSELEPMAAWLRSCASWTSNLRMLIANHSIGWCLTKGWLLCSWKVLWSTMKFPMFQVHLLCPTR
jgi:hypothetical protein